MFGITGHTRVYIRTGATDGRLGFEGLKALTVNVIREDPMCRHLMVFCNGPRNRIKRKRLTSYRVAGRARVW